MAFDRCHHILDDAKRTKTKGSKGKGSGGLEPPIPRITVTNDIKSGRYPDEGPYIRRRALAGYVPIYRHVAHLTGAD